MKTLNDRMKEYEKAPTTRFTRRTPVIIRIDGKAFHTFTKGLNKPFDEVVNTTMILTTKYLCKHIQGCKVGYTQSDEINLLITDYDTLETDAFFDYKIQKIVSVAASMATLAFNKYFRETLNNFVYENGSNLECEEVQKLLCKYDKKVDTALFDARAFNLPKEEVCNYFIYRQSDAIRNSIQSLGQAYYSEKQLHRLNTKDIKEILKNNKNVDWEDCSSHQKNGIVVVKHTYYLNGDIMRKEWISKDTTPIFKENREFINNFVFLED